jgi:4-amino-4-deoxy-L-arabinose transferase-like glycosyltransferase
VIFWLITIVLAVIGWRWRRWRGVVIVLLAFWGVMIVLGVLGLMAMGPTLERILQTYPAPSS